MCKKPHFKFHTQLWKSKNRSACMAIFYDKLERVRLMLLGLTICTYISPSSIKSGFFWKFILPRLITQIIYPSIWFLWSLSSRYVFYFLFRYSFVLWSLKWRVMGPKQALESKHTKHSFLRPDLRLYFFNLFQSLIYVKVLGAYF